jgi:CRP-like cAMP-binding protein
MAEPIRIRRDILDGAAMQPVLRRMRALGPCSDEQTRRVTALGHRVQTAAAKALLQTMDEPLQAPRYVVAGWACHFRLLADGRRQLFDLVLPGDGLGVCLDNEVVAMSNTAALTAVRMVDASALLSPEQLASCPELVQSLRAAAKAEDQRRLDHIVRLGRLTALERLAHLLLELHDRLANIGLVEGRRFPLPLTQETLADLLGLSVVHVNRTMQELRRRQLAEVGGGMAVLHAPDHLATLIS